MRGFRLGIIEELTPAEAVLVEHFRALPLEERRALLNVLDQAAVNRVTGSSPMTFLLKGWERSNPHH